MAGLFTAIPSGRASRAHDRILLWRDGRQKDIRTGPRGEAGDMGPETGDKGLRMEGGLPRPGSSTEPLWGMAREQKLRTGTGLPRCEVAAIYEESDQ